MSAAAIASLLAVALAPLVAAPADAKSPQGALFCVPSAATITLVGTDATGTPDPIGLFQVQVQDVVHQPVGWADVWIDFSACPDVRIASTQPYPGLNVSCASRVVGTTSDPRGIARFIVVGGGLGTPGAGSTGPVVMVNASAVPGYYGFARIRASAYDLGGTGGVGASDLSLWVGDFLSSQPYARSDYDGSGTLSANDLALWVKCFLGAGSTVSAPTCP